MRPINIAERTRLRETHLNAAQKPEGEFPPYTEDEQRVCDYLTSIVDIGCGSDPIGFLIAAHNLLRQRGR